MNFALCKEEEMEIARIREDEVKRLVYEKGDENE